MNLKLENIKECFRFKTPLVWRNVISIFILHVLFFYTLITILPKTKFTSIFFGYVYGYFGGLSVTTGAHRLWTHKTYKGTLLLRILLMAGYLSAGQYSIVQWARDHRLHHKFSDTDADPHNAKRGFFFSHCGWLMMKRHPEVKEKGKLIDVSDLWQDPVVAFQQKYFVPLLVFFHFILPTLIGYYILNESLIRCILGLFFFRYCILLNFIWTVNSVTHLYGYKPYNKSIMAVQNKKAAFVTLGEGWHNFHHVFPWDYRIGEYGQGNQYGANFIELWAKLGLAYDLKTASPEMVQAVLQKAEKEPVTEVPDPGFQNNNKLHENKDKIK